MNITVLGLWHLGSVTAACCAERFSVTALDFDKATLDGLARGKAPVMEPGLDALIAAGLESGRLRLSNDPIQACSTADLLWVCYDTLVSLDDVPDCEFVFDQIRSCAPHLPAGSILLISSQMPVGTCRALEAAYPHLNVACAPENLRLGKALDVFRNPDRIILGVRDEATRSRLEPLFSNWSDNLVWMRPESAEMTKHGINSFLALSITFANEIARLCEVTGADAREVEHGLKSERRIGPGACLHPGSAFAGGTLARDVNTLVAVASEHQEPLDLIPGIKKSNDRHKLWALGRLRRELGDLRGRIIAILGLTYKPGTNTLRRSLAIELCGALLQQDARVRTFDPSLDARPDEIGTADFFTSMQAAVADADAAVICTPWPEITAADWPALAGQMRQPVILDADGVIAAPAGSRYLTVGQPS